MVPLTIIMPAYNEAASITAAVGDVKRNVLSVVPDAEFLVVDDGSSDATGAILQGLAASISALRVVTKTNGGHGTALLRGLSEAKGDAVLLLDSDCQIPLEQFAEHWAMFRGQDLVAFLGVRRPRHDPFHRLIVTRLMRGLIALTFGRAPQDGGAPYKIVRRAQWQEAATIIDPQSWIPSVLLSIHVLRNYPDRVAEVPVRHLARAHGHSTLNIRRLSQFCLAAAAEVVRFRKELRQGTANTTQE